VTEPLIKRLTGKGHEDLESVLVAPKNEREKDAKTAAAPTIAEVVEAHHLDTRKILGYIKGEKTEGVRKRDLSRILNGEIDVDKMDYLVRDSYYTGVAYGVVDNIRLIQGLNFFNDELVLTEKGVLPAEYLLFSRFLMHPTVYNHHTGRIAQLMLLNAAALRTMDDSEINIALRNAGGYPNEMITRLKERRLFKRAIYTNVSELDASAAEGLRDKLKVREVEAELSKRAGVDKQYVLLDYQKPKGEELEESAAKVVIGNEFRSLRDVSSLVSMLSREFEQNYKIGVYTPEEYRAEVKKAAEEMLWK
jgi:HD superfamily phosphohydrolase